MAFDVSKFLALTVLIAGTGAACSSTGDKDEPAGGAGTSGSAGQSSAGKSGNQGGAADAGSGGAAAGNAGEGGGLVVGGASAGAGGESLGGAAGAGGAGGAPDVGECLGELSAGGAGGAGAVEVDPSLEGLCSDFYQTDCGAEVLVPSYTVCEGVRYRAQPAVAVAVADCITALSVTDECDGAKVSACFTGLEGRGCANPDGAAACVAMKERAGCDAIDLASCENVADLLSPDGFAAFVECMDPSIEGYYNPDFAGTCVDRLYDCAGVQL